MDRDCKRLFNTEEEKKGAPPFKLPEYDIDLNSLNTDEYEQAGGGALINLIDKSRRIQVVQ